MSVFENPWHSETPSPNEPPNHPPVRLASTTDRLAAFLVDVTVGFLFVNVLIAPFRRQFVYSVLNEDVRMYLLSLAATIALAILTLMAYQTVGVWKFGGTVGKRIFKIQVVNVWTLQSPTLYESFWRSVAWLGSWIILGFPFFEVLSNPRRRAYHDRVADCIVVSRSSRQSLAPNFQERSLVKMVYVSVTVALISFGALQVKYIFSEWKSLGDMLGILSNGDRVCQDVSDAQEQWPTSGGEKESRLKIALTLYAVDAIDEDCLDVEARSAFYFHEALDEAYLAKAFATSENPDLSDQYLDKVCDVNDQGDACALTKVILAWTEKNWAAADRIFSELSQSPYLNIWAVKHFEKTRNYGDELKLVQQLRGNPMLKGYVGMHETVALWGQHRRAESRQAFESAIDDLDSDQKSNLASWMCDLELEENCLTSSYSCQVFLKDFSTESEIPGGVTGLTYVKALSCQPEFSAQIPAIKSQVADPRLYQYVVGLEARMSSRIKDSQKIMQDLLAQVKDDSRFTYEIYSQKLQMTGSFDDVQDIESEWKNNDNRSWYWLRLGQRIFDKYRSMGASDAAVATAAEILKADPEDSDLKKDLVVVLYKSGRLKEARDLVRQLSDSGRQVASQDEFLEAVLKLRSRK